jgi:hypothetical protein
VHQHQAVFAVVPGQRHHLLRQAAKGLWGQLHARQRVDAVGVEAAGHHDQLGPVALDGGCDQALEGIAGRFRRRPAADVEVAAQAGALATVAAPP